MNWRDPKKEKPQEDQIILFIVGDYFKTGTIWVDGYDDYTIFDGEYMTDLADVSCWIPCSEIPLPAWILK